MDSILPVTHKQCHSIFASFMKICHLHTCIIVANWWHTLCNRLYSTGGTPSQCHSYHAWFTKTCRLHTCIIVLNGDTHYAIDYILPVTHPVNVVPITLVLWKLLSVMHSNQPLTHSQWVYSYHTGVKKLSSFYLHLQHLCSDFCQLSEY